MESVKNDQKIKSILSKNDLTVQNQDKVRSLKWNNQRNETAVLP